MANRSETGCSRSQPPSGPGSTGGSDGIGGSVGAAGRLAADEERVAEGERGLMAEPFDRHRRVLGTGRVDDEGREAEPALVRPLADVGVLDARPRHADLVPPDPA